VQDLNEQDEIKAEQQQEQAKQVTEAMKRA